jgi:hypothetical protein
MKRRKLLTLLFLLSLSAGIFYACLDEIGSFGDSGRNNNRNRDGNLPSGVAAAKAWFDNEVTEGYIPWHVGGENTRLSEKGNLLIPNWRRALSNEDSVYRVTEILLQSAKTIIQTTPEVSRKFMQTGDRRYLASDVRLVVRTHKETGEKDGFVMVVYPDLTYLEKNLNAPLRNFTYLKRDKDFSGIVYYHDLNGEFVNGWRYRDGNIHVLHPRSFVISNSQLRSAICDGFCPHCVFECEIWQRFTDIFIGGEFSHTIPGETYTNYDRCFWVRCTPPSPPGGGGGGGGGGNWGGYDPPPPPDDPPPPLNNPVTVRLGVCSRTVDLGSTVIFTATAIGNDVANRVSSMRIEIGRSSGGAYTELYSSSSTAIMHSRALLAPGSWMAHAVATLNDGSTVNSPLSFIEVQFPDVSTIRSNSTISTAMNNMWQQTKNAASYSGRQEFGFWIYANTTSGNLVFEAGATQSGNSVSGCVGTNASIDPGSPNEIQSSDRNNPLLGGRFAIAHFHTHTPLSFCNVGERGVGPTGSNPGDTTGDIPWTTRQNIPGLVYDYTGVNNAGRMVIMGGHGLHDPAQVYTFGPSRRPTPLF